jgi:hypothetical protein
VLTALRYVLSVLAFSGRPASASDAIQLLMDVDVMPRADAGMPMAAQYETYEATPDS